MELLNLDDLAKVVRKVTVDGTDHDVVEMDVEGMIESVKRSKELDKMDPESAEHFEASIAFIHRAIPSLAPERIKKLKLRQIDALSKFITANVEEEVQKGVQAQGEAPGKQ